jgi:hypothetical protein
MADDICYMCLSDLLYGDDYEPVDLVDIDDQVLPIDFDRVSG